MTGKTEAKPTNPSRYNALTGRPIYPAYIDRLMRNACRGGNVRTISRKAALKYCEMNMSAFIHPSSVWPSIDELQIAYMHGLQPRVAFIARIKKEENDA